MLHLLDSGTSMNTEIDLSIIWDFATALLIGALIGIEREKRGAEEGGGGIGGLRTFILVAMIGAVAGLLSRGSGLPWLLVAALLAVAALALAGYIVVARIRPASLGLTTEIAALAVCLLGGLTMLGHRELAIGLAVAAAAVLAYKQPLHGLVGKLSWDDVLAGVRLLIATFIVLPLLPDRPVDPWQALNPYSLWLLVILISSLSLIGYLATRWVGAGKGTALTGITGGLVSSTAVTLFFARRSRDAATTGAVTALASGILLAWTIMFARIVVEVLVVNADLLGRVLIPFVAMGLVAAGFAWLFYYCSAGRTAIGTEAGKDWLRNPFSITAAAKFAVLFAAVLLLLKGMQLYFPRGGTYLVAALAGLTDVDAITLSMAKYAKTNDPATAVTAIVLAALTNTLVKCGIVMALGDPALRRPLLLATGAIVLTGVGTMVFVRVT
jgi:uncharacterized membrane protein (DUF4010 family)